MWDLANGKLLRTITDAHPPGTAILHLKVDPIDLLVCMRLGFFHNCQRKEKKKRHKEKSVFLFFFHQFTDLPTLAVCNDSGGSVFELSFR